MTDVRELVLSLYEIVDALEREYPERHFTPDGHLVGSLGEAMAAEAFGLELLTASNKGFDARWSADGVERTVEIKATQAKSIALQADVDHPDHLIALHIDRNSGRAEVIYNGPAPVVCEAAGVRQKNGQRRIGLNRLRQLMAEVPQHEQLPQVADLP